MRAESAGPDSQALTETVSCMLCGSSRYEILRKARYPTELTSGWLLQVYSSSSDKALFDQLARCRDCSLVYLNPRVREDIIQKAYSDAVDPVFIAQDAGRIQTFKRSLRKVARKHSLASGPATRVLDVGCAGGAFVKAAADLGYPAVGVEPSRWLSEQGRLRYGLDIRAGTLADQDFADASFGLVTLWDVIEHLTRPSEVLAQIHRLLRPSGMLIVNYPDYGSLARRILGFKWPFFLSVHLIYFTRQTITRFLEERGFSVVEIEPFFQTLGLGYVLRRASAHFNAFGIAGRLAGKLGADGLPFTYNVGQSLLVARKKA